MPDPAPHLETLPLSYALPRSAPTGLFTALGIISIVIGGLSIAASSRATLTEISWLSMSAVVSLPNSTTLPGSAALAVSSYYFPVSRAASICCIIAQILSFAVATLLFIAGILLLRGACTALRLHRIYALIKIPVVILAIIASGWRWIALQQSMSAMLGNGLNMPLAHDSVVEAVVVNGAGMIYPIILLVLLSRENIKRQVRRHCDPSAT